MSFQISKTKQQEQFSIAYIRAIVSAAGYALEEITVDEDSIDCSVTQRGNGNTYPEIESLRVQLKCTFAHKPHAGYLNYPLSIKNYNDLRRKCMNPRILVVLHVPKDCDDWIQHNENSITLNHLSYWVSIKGMPETYNEKNVSIKIPTAQQFTIETLKNLMNKLANGEDI
ncbi:MAG: DUF4365 domain-containing protein [Methylococcales bacterium]|nr:DUF4365 domain-containing protein [Methylococcales bacterium]MDD5753318.1 DUF4365 domain-containing protein [Methylococcales bacterium]